MPTKDRLSEFQKLPTKNLITDQPELETTSSSQNKTEQKIEKGCCHLIGNGGKLAEFFDDVENIGSAIGGLKKRIEEMKLKQSEILSTPLNHKLKQQLEDIKADIKQRINSKIRTKVTFRICNISNFLVRSNEINAFKFT